MRKFLLIGLIAVVFFLPTAAATEPTTVQVPIVMYHSLAKSGGETTIDADAFEADLRYLQAEGFTAVTLTQLADFVHHNAPLPDRPVVLTFDDGYYNNYAAALPLAQQYNMPIVISVIGRDTEKWSENPYDDLRYGHVSWGQICEMVDTGLVEIANHTWDLHTHANGRKGAMIRPGEGAAAYRAVLTEDVQRLQFALGEHCGITPVAFVYPFCAASEEATDILADLGFLVTLICGDGQNTLTQGDPTCLYNMLRYHRTPDRSVESILSSLS